MTDGARTTTFPPLARLPAWLAEPAFREFALYFLGSAVALAIDFGLLILLKEVFGIPTLVAAAIGFVSGAAALYLISIALIFGERRIDNAPLEFSMFFAIGLVGLLISLAGLYVFVEGFGIYYPIAKIGTVGAVFAFNFIARKTILFKHAAPLAGQQVQ